MRMTQMAAIAAITFALSATPAVLNAAPAAPNPTPQATPKMPRQYNLNQIHCSDLLQADLLDRSAAVMFLWGYEAGRQGVTTFNTQKLEAATRGLMQVCEKQPSLTVFAAIDVVKKNYAK